MKKVTLTITALVTDKACEDEIEYYIDDKNEDGKNLSPSTALRISERFDNNYAEVIHAEVTIETVKL